MQTRRQFVRGAAGAGAVVVFAPQALAAGLTRASKAPLLADVAFDQGVMSGDPTSSAITLLTHVGGAARAGALNLEVASDKGFRKVVANQQVRTNAALGDFAKARVKGLKPGEDYFFRFDAKDGHSPVGRFRTAPAKGSKETIRFAMVSCMEYTFGYYNALQALSKEQDLDFVLQLGDYIYADVAFPTPLGVRTDPTQNAVTLPQYRDKYALSRSDKSLQAVQAQTAWINLWDDHEVQNNYAGGDPAGGEVTSDFNPVRKVNGYKAFYQCLPTYAQDGKTRIYHSANFGSNLDLFVLDERQYRSRQPCGKDKVPVCTDASNPSLTMLGAAQDTFVQGGLRASKARWKVIANEVEIMRRLEKDGQSGVDDRDAWGGYLADREALLQVAKNVPGTVFCTGDVHEFVAGTVKAADGSAVAPEVTVSSITAGNDVDFGGLKGTAGFGTANDPLIPAGYLEERLAANPEWAYLDPKSHGYIICEVTADDFKWTMHRMNTVRRKDTGQAATVTARATHGDPTLKVG